MTKKMTTARAVRIAALIFVAGCSSESPDEMLTSARAYLAKRDVSAATIQLKNVLSKNPKLAEARLLLGQTLLESGDAVAAELELRKALELKSPPEKVVPTLAKAMLLQGQAKKVLAEFADQPKLSGEAFADLRTIMAQAYASTGDLASAEKSIQAAIAEKSDYAPALLANARLMLGKGQPDAALETVDAVLAANPKRYEAWLLKGDLLRLQRKGPDAISAFQKALEIQPGLLGARASLISIHLRDQDHESARKQVEAMAKQAPNSPMTLYMQGLYAFSTKDMTKARNSMDALLRIQPKNPRALQLAGLIAFTSKSDVQAQEYLGKAIQNAPMLDMGRRALILSYMRSGQSAKALETLKPVLQTSNPDPMWLKLAGDAQMLSGNAKAAEEQYRLAATADPKNQKYRTALAMARLQSGNSDQALSDLEHIASEDTEGTADMALISQHMSRRRYDKALSAIAALEKKQPANLAIHNMRGAALLAKGDRNGARASLEKALAIDPSYFPAATALAQLDIADKKPELARKRFESVLAKDPKNASAQLAIAEIAARTGGKPDEIAKMIEKAIAASPESATPRIALANFYVTQKDARKALSVIQEAISALPDRAELLSVAGQVYRLNGDTNQALDTYAKLASLTPASDQPYLSMAEIHMAGKNKAAARDALMKGLQIHSKSIALQRALIILDIDGGRFAEALSSARQIQQDRPKEPAGYVLEGDIFLAKKDSNEAATAYRKGMQAAPTTDLAERAYAALQLGQKKSEAAALSDAWLKAHPTDNTFRLFLAEAANKRGEFQLAIEQYKALLAKAPNNPALLNNLAWSLDQAGDPRALESAEHANKLAPNRPEIEDTLGSILVRSGNLERGLGLLAKALEQAPNSSEIRLNYAKALIKAGKKADAKRVLEPLATLGEKFPAHLEVKKLMSSL